MTKPFWLVCSLACWACFCHQLRRIAIIGSGYIGLEFSDVYTALGSEVRWGAGWQQWPCIAQACHWRGAAGEAAARCSSAGSPLALPGNRALALPPTSLPLSPSPLVPPGHLCGGHAQHHARL